MIQNSCSKITNEGTDHIKNNDNFQSYSKGGVFIHEIHPGGPADKGGKLKAGDKIVKVNEVDFLDLTHKEGLNALRSAQDKVISPCYLAQL